MATIFTRKDNSGNLRFYGNLSLDGKRIRKYLGTSKRVAQQRLIELEYSLRFEVTDEENRNNVTFHQASISRCR